MGLSIYRQLILPLILFVLLLNIEPSNARTIQDNLDGRKIVIDQYKALSAADKKSDKGLVLAIAANTLFFKAQQQRLNAEIAELKNYKASFTDREWFATANKEKRLAKEKELEFFKSLEKNPPQRAIRCVSELNGKDLPSSMQSAFDVSQTVISKASLNNQLTWNSAPVNTKKSKPTATKVVSYFEQSLLQSPLPHRNISYRHSSRVNAKEQSFLSSIGASDRSIPTSNDQSWQFTNPKLQPQKTAMCAGYAISADMETKLNGATQLHKVSPEYTYRAILKGEAGVQASGLCPFIGQPVNRYAGAGSIASSLEILSKTPVCSTDNPKASRVLTTQYKIGSYESLSVKNPNVDFLKTAIVAGKPPMVTIITDARVEKEDWIFPKNAGSFSHVVNVVGFGSGREPDCLDEVEYFTIRDSLGKKPIHYKIKATDLLPRITSIHKIKSVNEDVLNRVNPLNSLNKDGGKLPATK